MTSINYGREFPKISYSRQTYRTSLGIINDIVEICMNAGTEGIRISRISQMANLSHSVVVYNCQKLTNADIIRPNRDDKKYIFTITEKGIKFFYELQRFLDIAKQVNIRY